MSGCVACVTVRHEVMTHPLTCGNARVGAHDAPRGASPQSDNDSQTTSLQVTASRLTKTCTSARVRHTPLTHPLTCGNTPCVTNGQNADPLCRNEIQVRHDPPLRGVRAYARAHTRAYARGAGLPTNPSKGEKP